MKFSFLIPVYNTRKYLAKCLDSVLCQQSAEFEIVLLDDGSTDGSSDICDDYARRYPGIVHVIHKENEGSLLTRCRGFREAKGDWVICVDSDDTVAPDLLGTVSGMIREGNFDMVMYNFDYVGEDGKHRPSRLTIPDGTVYEGENKQLLYEKKLLTVDVNTMWMRAIRRDIIDMDTDYSNCGIRNMCDDAIQMLSLYTNAKRIAYTDRVLYHYRKGNDTITGRQGLDRWQASKRCFELTEPYLDKWQISAETKTRFYTKACEEVIDFMRWLVGEKADIKSFMQKINKDAGFARCTGNYDSRLSSTRYNAFCVPRIMKYIRQEKVFRLKMYFYLEKLARKIIKKPDTSGRIPMRDVMKS